MTYEHDGQAAEDFTPGDHYATVSGHKECQDTIDPNNRAEDYDNTLADGESNFLPVGTRLYRVPGYAGTERLAADHDHDGEWAIVSVLQPDSASAR